MNTTLAVNCASKSYPVHFITNALNQTNQLFDLNRRVLIVTDSGVPKQYSETVAKQCLHPIVVCVNQGEGSKSFETLQTLLAKMLAQNFTRHDCVVAVGGGVVGDLAGFAAATYMRGVDFYNIPTTTLSQIDSSVGGKTAINFAGVKNSIGVFYQPKAVLIDTSLLETLDQRQIASGLAEAVKMGFIYDPQLIELFLKTPIDLPQIIYKSICDKARIVSQDETEQGLRKILNFGHTIGHGYEAAANFERLTHGESVALGMIAMCDHQVKPTLLKILTGLGLPTTHNLNKQAVWDAMLHDKKMAQDGIDVIFVTEIGTAQIQRVSPESLKEKL